MICDTRLGGKPRWYLTPPKDWNMRVPDQVRDCVVFLGIQVTRMGGRTEFVWAGSAFFVAIPSESEPETCLYTYLVTAKHVIDEIGDREIFVRINQRQGGAVIASLRGARWHFHETEATTVDVAVLPIAPSPEQFAYKVIGTDTFLTDTVIQTMGIGVGDEVFMTGLFAHMSGKEQNIPIVRMGNVAMMPNDTVPTEEYGDIEAYLIEARSIGGLSGSPVFVRESSNMYVPASNTPFFLMGLMHGHWKVPAGDANPAPLLDSAISGKNETINMGIAIVVPARKIIEVLNVTELREDRAEQEKTLRNQNLPVMDSAMPEAGEHKTPAKPISLYPMDEEEVLKRLLRVPPPEKGTKD